MSEEKKASILLVEDEENLHEALKLNLELEGYDVTSPTTVRQRSKASMANILTSLSWMSCSLKWMALA